MVAIQGQRMDLGHAIDSEGEILDGLGPPRRDKVAALKLMRRLLKQQGYAPTVLVTDTLPSSAAARRALGLSARHNQGLRKSNPPATSHQMVRRRERTA